MIRSPLNECLVVDMDGVIHGSLHMDEHVTDPMLDNADGLDGINLQNPVFHSPVGKAAAVVFSNIEGCDETVEEPCVGMAFCSWQDLEVYYKEYGKKKGFGIARAGCATRKHRTERTSMTWRCEQWGDPDRRSKDAIKKKPSTFDDGLCSLGTESGEGVRKKRPSKKCFCTAMIYAGINDDGNWVIKKVVNDHANHTPVPSNAKLVKEYRMQSFNRNVRRRLINDTDVGVPISKIYSALARERDGLENIPFTEKDMRHFVDKERKLKMEGGDANALVSYFERMQRDNLNFFHAHRLDSTGHMQDVLWVDARSRAAYEEFGDVVCFDSTYLTNEYELPFINFVGINHHGQSTLFGCALVSQEDSETFAWVFRQWLLCMKGRAPIGILTDQAAAMRKPIEETMPDTRHRWCMWHILQKLPRKLGALEEYQKMKDALLAVVYDSSSIEAFEQGWDEVMETYNLQQNEWLLNLFAERHMWVPVYMKELFWAGMRTTQRVESINSFFDQFITRHTRLCEFGEKYCAAIEKRICQERDADAKCGKWVRNLSTGFKIEKVYRKIYTDTMFRKIQRECERLAYCYVREEVDAGDNKLKYLLEDRIWKLPKGYTEAILTDKRTMICVVFDTVTREAVCDCRHFETCGLLCRHMIRVFDQNLVDPLPEKYILRRWRKDIPRKHSRINIAYHDPSKTECVKRSDKIMIEFECLCDLASSADETTELAIQALKDAQKRVLAWQSSQEGSTQTVVDNTMMQPTGVPSTGLDTSLDCSAPTEVAISTDQASQSQTVVNETTLTNTPSSTKQSQTYNVLDPPIKKKRGRPQTTCYSFAGLYGWPEPNKETKGKGKRKNAEGIDKGKGKSKKKSQKTSTESSTPSQGSREHDGAAIPSKMKVIRPPRSVSFSDDVICSFRSTHEDDLMCRNNLLFDDNLNIGS